MPQDKMFLQKLAGGGQYIHHEGFNNLWAWFYPFASALSWPTLREAWEVSQPVYIARLMTREEAEELLVGFKAS